MSYSDVIGFYVLRLLMCLNAFRHPRVLGSITACLSRHGVTLKRLSADGDVSMATQLSGQQQLVFLRQVDKTEGWSPDNAKLMQSN